MGRRTLKIAFAFDSLSNPQARAFARDVAAFIMGRAIIEHQGAPPNTRPMVAVHEAGHAVMMAAAGNSPGEVALYTTNKKRWGGYCAYGGDASGDPAQDVHLFDALPRLLYPATFALAGHVGELCEVDGPKPDSYGGAHEIGFVVYLAAYAEANFGANAVAFMCTTAALIQGVIAENRAAADTLIAKLQRTRRVDGRFLADWSATIKPVDIEARWLELYRAGTADAPRFGSLCDAAIFGVHLARSAHAAYGAQYGS